MDSKKINEIKAEYEAAVGSGKLEAFKAEEGKPLATAIANGSVILALGEVKDRKSGKVECYAKLIALDLSGCEAIAGNVSRVVRDFNYGCDLKAKALVRQRLMAKLEGPDKAIRRAAEDMVKSGAASNVQEAETFIRQLRKQRGLDA